MPHRTLPPLKLESSPLVLVLGQARMSPVLQMETYLPSIQEALRREGYPRFDIQVTQEVMFGAEFKLASGANWIFSDREKSEAVVLSPSFITVMVNRYETFDEFSEKLARAFSIVAERAGLDLCERLGLRYVDLVRLREGESWSDYLVPGLLGPPLEVIEPSRYTYRFEGRATTGMGELALKLYHVDGGRFLPPDLAASELEFDVEIAEEEIVTILDTDHFSVLPRDFEVDALIEDMWILHDKIDVVFRNAVTETALKRWGALWK